MLEMVSGITGIQAERNQHNDASSRKIPPFLPHQLVTMQQKDFNEKNVSNQSERLHARWELNKICAIEYQFDEVKTLYQQDKNLKMNLSKCDCNTSFEELWLLISIKLPKLRKFCGGVATVAVKFPYLERLGYGTEVREEDFYHPSHQMLYRSMVRLRDENQPVDLTTLADQPGVHSTATAVEDDGFDASVVVRMDVVFPSSSALDNLSFCQ